MSTQAVADARLGLLYHAVWSKPAANDTFARWAREDFVNLAGVAEAIWAYDHTPGALDGGVDRVLGISQVLHTWAGQLEAYRREYRAWIADRTTAPKPADPFPTLHPGAGEADAPKHMFRRLAGSMLRNGTFAQVVAPGESWIPHTSTAQLHQVLQVEADRRTRITDRTRTRQMNAGAREAAAQAAADRAINWTPIEANIQRRIAARNLSV